MGDNKILLPQRKLFLDYWLDPKSPTFSNVLQSALKAGFKQEYAESLSYKMPKWLSEAVGDTKLMELTNKNLEEALQGGMDEAGKSQKIKWDSTKFVAKGLQKDKWSDRHEHTGKDGKELPQPIIQLDVSGNNSNKEDKEPNK